MSMYTLDFEKPIAEIENRIDELRQMSIRQKVDFTQEIKKLEKKLEKEKESVFMHLNSWQRTQLARHPLRPYFMDYCSRIIDGFIELHGDRRYRDDAAIICGLGYLGDERVAVLGQQKGKDTQENLHRNFGSMHPEGYRKAMRIMELAGNYNLPIITFIDTMGAFPGIGAEERGQAEAIANNLRGMADLEVPIISIVIGEGGSGGALGIGVTNRILMLENSIYSVISPEGCASILWHDASKAPVAAEAMRITAPQLYALGVIDEIIKEPLGGAHSNYDKTADNIKKVLKKHLSQLLKLNGPALVENRYKKFRNLGEYINSNGKLVSSKRKKK